MDSTYIQLHSESTAVGSMADQPSDLPMPSLDGQAQVGLVEMRQVIDAMNATVQRQLVEMTRLQSELTTIREQHEQALQAQRATLTQEMGQRLQQQEQELQRMHQLLQQSQLRPTTGAAVDDAWLSKSFKYPAPERWSGKGDMFAHYYIPISQWLSVHGKANSPEGVEAAAAHLPSHLQANWAKYKHDCAAANMPLPASFDALWALVRRWYPQPDSLRSNMEKMETLRQKPNRMVEYNEQWSYVILELGGNATLYTINFKYFRGLQLDIQRDLEGKFNMATINTSELMSLASEAEARQKLMGNRGGNQAWRGRHNDQGASTSQSQEPVPMELGAVRATAHEFKGKCYKCHERGHKAKDCPKLTKK